MPTFFPKSSFQRRFRSGGTMTSSSFGQEFHKNEFASLLLLCLLVSGVGAMMGTLGKECRPNNRCLSQAYHICDTNAAEPKCKIKQGFNCARDSDQCVAGSSCQKKKCFCNSHTEAQDSGLCNPMPQKVGGDCNPQDSQPCDDRNARCTSTGQDKNKCQCLGSFTEDFEHYICTTPRKRVGGTCDPSEDQPCDDINADCVGSPLTCHCKTDFVINSWNLTCELDVDKDCGNREDECKQSTTCDPVNKRCRIAHDKSCRNETDKCVSGAECITKEDSIATCSCIPDVYVANATTGTCFPAAKRVGGFCDVDDVSPCDDVKAVCSTSSMTCVCQEGVPVNATTLACGRAASYGPYSFFILLSSVSWLMLSGS